MHADQYVEFLMEQARSNSVPLPSDGTAAKRHKEQMDARAGVAPVEEHGVVDDAMGDMSSCFLAG